MLLSFNLHFEEKPSMNMRSILLSVFLWTVTGLGKIHDSCSFVDVDYTPLASVFLAKSNCRTGQTHIQGYVKQKAGA